MRILPIQERPFAFFFLFAPYYFPANTHVLMRFRHWIPLGVCNPSETVSHFFCYLLVIVCVICFTPQLTPNLALIWLLYYLRYVPGKYVCTYFGIVQG